MSGERNEGTGSGADKGLGARKDNRLFRQECLITGCEQIDRLKQPHKKEHTNHRVFFAHTEKSKFARERNGMSYSNYKNLLDRKEDSSYWREERHMGEMSD